MFIPNSIKQQFVPNDSFLFIRWLLFIIYIFQKIVVSSQFHP